MSRNDISDLLPRLKAMFINREIGLSEAKQIMAVIQPFLTEAGLIVSYEELI
jgi:hypothetical protein